VLTVATRFVLYLFAVDATKVCAAPLKLSAASSIGTEVLKYANSSGRQTNSHHYRRFWRRKSIVRTHTCVWVSGLVDAATVRRYNAREHRERGEHHGSG